MGIDYHYANLTKREWFAGATFGENSKRSGLGEGLSARAFQLLLLGDERAPATASPVNLGRWARDQIVLIGDNDRDFERYDQEFTDIAADVIMLIYAYDGFEPLAEIAERRDGMFMELCHLAATQQKPSLERHLKEHFGENFWQRYSELCKKRPFLPKNVAFPKTSNSSGMNWQKGL